MNDTRHLFGTDGIRGVANRHPMTTEVAHALGRAVTAVFKGDGVPRIVVGKDTRLSGYMFEMSIAAGICSMGGEILLVGPLPTPAIAHLTRGMRAEAGIVISASHNPYQDNGIKIFGRDGFKLSDRLEALVERHIYMALAGDLPAPMPDQIGRASRIDDATGRYLEAVKSTFPKDLDLDGLRVVVDCADGAAYSVAPRLFAELGADVVPVGVNPDGTNINDGCGALEPERLSQRVIGSGADIGVALDGDADRCIVAAEDGTVVDGDRIMAICAPRMAKEERLPGKVVVATVMSNIGLERTLDSHGIRLERTQVGDRYVVERMREIGASFGGEQSGHLIFLDHASTGDGLVAGLQLLAVMRREGKQLSLLAGEMERFPQTLVNVVVREKLPMEALPRTSENIREAEAELGADGRVLVRYSGTEAKCRIMVEGPDQEAIEALAGQIAGTLTEEIGAEQ